MLKQEKKITKSVAEIAPDVKKNTNEKAVSTSMRITMIQPGKYQNTL